MSNPMLNSNLSILHFYTIIQIGLPVSIILYSIMTKECKEFFRLHLPWALQNTPTILDIPLALYKPIKVPNSHLDSSQIYKMVHFYVNSFSPKVKAISKNS